MSRYGFLSYNYFLLLLDEYMLLCPVIDFYHISIFYQQITLFLIFLEHFSTENC